MSYCALAASHVQSTYRHGDLLRCPTIFVNMYDSVTLCGIHASQTQIPW